MRAAALRLFAQHGYAAVSMRRIAGEVGVQAGALYNYTPDKQSLLFDLMREHMEALLATRAQMPKEGPVEALEAFTRFHIRFHSQRPDEVFVSDMELRSLEPDNFAVIEGLRRTYEGQLEAILRHGNAAGEFTVPEPKVSAMAVIAMLTGVNTWFRAGGRLSLGEVEDVYWGMVRRAAGA